MPEIKGATGQRTAMTAGAGDLTASRRGRPPGTNPRELEVIALRLFSELGYDATTVELIAAEAGVSKRTFFRYYDSKVDVLWSAFDSEVEALRVAFAKLDATIPLMDAIRQAVVSVNRYSAADVPELRTRMSLIGSVPALAASAAVHYDAWERAISEFAAQRLGTSPDALFALALGRATLASCRAAFDTWAARADADLTFYLDAAVRGLAAGFDPTVISSIPAGPRKARR